MSTLDRMVNKIYNRFHPPADDLDIVSNEIQKARDRIQQISVRRDLKISGREKFLLLSYSAIVALTLFGDIDTNFKCRAVVAEIVGGGVALVTKRENDENELLENPDHPARLAESEVIRMGLIGLKKLEKVEPGTAASEDQLEILADTIANIGDAEGSYILGNYIEIPD